MTAPTTSNKRADCSICKNTPAGSPSICSRIHDEDMPHQQSNYELDKILGRHPVHFNYSKAETKQALTKFIQQEKSALLNELLDSQESVLPDTHPPAKYVIEAVPISVIEAKLKDLNQGGEL